MTELDQALVALEASPTEPRAQMNFYGRFLDTLFFVPTKSLDPAVAGNKKRVDLPLIIENDGSNFLVFFDCPQRLYTWAGSEVPCAQMTGYVLAEISEPGIWWAMNVGAEHNKQFAPPEIIWLKDVIARFKGTL